MRGRGGEPPDIRSAVGVEIIGPRLTERPPNIHAANTKSPTGVRAPAIAGDDRAAITVGIFLRQRAHAQQMVALFEMTRSAARVARAIWLA